MDVNAIMNGLPMWLACSMAVILILVQALIIGKQAYSAGPRLGLSTGQMNAGIRSAAITSIGPSVVILSGMLSLLVSVGGPMAWMRLSLIGSVMFESMAAGIGTGAVGVTLGSDPMTEVAFAMAVWTMILGSIGWVIFSTISANRMDKVQAKLVKGDTAMLTTISTAAIIGSFSALSSSHLIKLNKNTIACVAGGAIMLVLMPLAEKKNIRWLKDWTLTFAILGGMLITLLF